MHLKIVAGFVVANVADELVLAHPYGKTVAKTAIMVIGGPMLFIGGTLVGLCLPGFASFTVPYLWPLGVAALAVGILVLIAVWEAVSLKTVKEELAPTEGGR